MAGLNYMTRIFGVASWHAFINIVIAQSIAHAAAFVESSEQMRKWGHSNPVELAKPRCMPYRYLGTSFPIRPVTSSMNSTGHFRLLLVHPLSMLQQVVMAYKTVSALTFTVHLAA